MSMHLETSTRFFKFVIENYMAVSCLMFVPGGILGLMYGSMTWDPTSAAPQWFTLLMSSSILGIGLGYLLTGSLDRYLRTAISEDLKTLAKLQKENS